MCHCFTGFLYKESSIRTIIHRILIWLFHLFGTLLKIYNYVNISNYKIKRNYIFVSVEKPSVIRCFLFLLHFSSFIYYTGEDTVKNFISQDVKRKRGLTEKKKWYIFTTLRLSLLYTVYYMSQSFFSFVINPTVLKTSSFYFTGVIISQNVSLRYKLNIFGPRSNQRTNHVQWLLES